MSNPLAEMHLGQRRMQAYMRRRRTSAGVASRICITLTSTPRIRAIYLNLDAGLLYFSGTSIVPVGLGTALVWAVGWTAGRAGAWAGAGAGRMFTSRLLRRRGWAGTGCWPHNSTFWLLVARRSRDVEVWFLVTTMLNTNRQDSWREERG